MRDCGTDEQANAIMMIELWIWAGRIEMGCRYSETAAFSPKDKNSHRFQQNSLHSKAIFLLNTGDLWHTLCLL
jgi:hypothetical protein